MTRFGDRVTPARALAYETLERIRKTSAFANEAIDSIVDVDNATKEDKAFATRLILGVVSSSGALDTAVKRFMDSPKGIKGALKTALRICAYEILYLKKDPYAAVDQCVEIVKIVQPRAAGLANAVMRRLAESEPDFPYGDPSNDIDAYSLLHGFPVWMVSLIRDELSKEEASEFVIASNRPAPIFMHFNALKCEKSDIEKIARMDAGEKGVSLCGIEIGNCIRLLHAKTIADDRIVSMIEDGLVLVSDASAQLICQIACNVVQGLTHKDRISCLELCSGRGTKTIILQSLMKLAGMAPERYVAVDNIPFKADLLTVRAKTYGARVDECIARDARYPVGSIADETFDLVFLDAPCSGIGTMRRHPDIRWRVGPDIIEENANLDLELIKAASSHVRHAGILVYSTCTITSAENEDVIEKFLASDEGMGFRIIPIADRRYLRTPLRIDGNDSHFCTVLARKELI